ncbi:MAG: glycosyltransferase, partial [Lachnospiraceae bacterium]|nr:glycosyltransferase [Lachnospiraceae bacterium]
MSECEKRISVIVTAYNIEEYLPRCMESLLGQTCPGLEIILVDDGSTDRTPEICDRYEREHECVRVIHKENGGPSSARNAGVAAAVGDFIGYVDGDDWVEPEMYERMLVACLEKDADVAICTYRQVGRGAEQIHPTGKVLELAREEALELYISGHPQYHIYHSVWSKLFRKELIADIRFPEGRKSEDI